MPKGTAVIRALVAGGVAIIAAGPAFAQSEVTHASSFDWTGFYLGIHMGGGAELSDFNSPFGSSIYGDDVTAPFYGIGAQGGVNWQLPDARVVFGVEADFEYRDGTGTNTCFAFDGTFISPTCRTDLDWAGTLTGRVGLAAGDQGRSLFYLKGGAALQREHITATTNNAFFTAGTNQTYKRNTDWGWTVGVGVERAVAPGWSVNLEYDYTDFGRSSVTTPDSATVTAVPVNPVATAVPATSASVDQTSHQFKLGVNYHFGVREWGARGEWSEAEESAPVAAEFADGWSFESGLRYWYSTGKFKKDLASLNTPATNLVSRLTYDNVASHSGEAFARIDTPFNLFVKGTVGIGLTNGGKLNDEDWGQVAGVATSYSNTISNLSDDDQLRYTAADLGVSLLKNARAKVGPFVGYSYYYNKMTATDCRQIALPTSTICSPAITNTTVISQKEGWDGIRLGGSAEVMLSDRIKLTGDAAFLPYVNFAGVDNHPLRPFVADEQGTGRGVQLEAIVSMALTDNFSLGVGGRYWSMWTTQGSDRRTFPGQAPFTPDRTDTFNTERYGVMVQGSYKFGMPKRAAN